MGEVRSKSESIHDGTVAVFTIQYIPRNIIECTLNVH